MDLITELRKRRDFFNTQLEKYLSDGTPDTLYNAARHLPMAGGKRLRPGLAMICCEAVNGDIQKVIPLSIALELIHNFTLVHDDIMDKSKMRRNISSTHIKYGEPTAIMAGDLLFTKAFESIHNMTGECKIFKNVEFGLIDCIREICEGQQMDLDFEKRKIVAEGEYLEMIRKKTAVFFQYAAEAGAIVGGGSREEINALNEFGLNLGIGFQIWDDYLDISSNIKTLGKDIGNDIRNGKKTLIAVHSLNNATGEEKKAIDKVFGNTQATFQQIEEIYDIFEKIGSIEYGKNKAIYHIKKAKNAIEILNETEAKKILLNLANYTISREK
jgi:geranylgeranyl diphosphate synthase type I